VNTIIESSKISSFVLHVLNKYTPVVSIDVWFLTKREDIVANVERLLNVIVVILSQRMVGGVKSGYFHLRTAGFLESPSTDDVTMTASCLQMDEIHETCHIISLDILQRSKDGIQIYQR
jgi:hypothetical protein